MHQENNMVTVEKIDTRSKAQVRRFVRLPFTLYAEDPNWVPPLLMDSEAQLNRQKHPFYEHSEGDFFIATVDGRDVGRIGVFENIPYNKYHDLRRTQFYFFESLNDQAIANTLFERAFEWARARKLNEIIGPKGISALDGYGMLVEGFKHRQTMTMMKYNYDYYPRLVETLGFEKEVDFVSCELVTEQIQVPERVHSIAERVRKRGRLQVKPFRSKRELARWAGRIGKAYNDAFVNNWEYYPLSDREIKFVLDNILIVADPRLIKLITHEGEVVGFLLGFPDVSAALQRARGKLLPFGIFDLLLSLQRTRWIALNGAGILPEFQGRGGNALLYSEMEKTVRDHGFEHAEMSQVAETAVQMRHDLENLGGKPYKNHRVYVREI